MLDSKSKMKVIFRDIEFEYEFDSTRCELTLIINKDNNSDYFKKRINIEKTMSIKDEIIILEDKSFMWHIKECKYYFANKIVFIIDYMIETYDDNLEICTIELKSKTLDSILHPANYFYYNQDLAKNDILYNRIEMKKFDFNFENIKIKASIFIGDLLNRGICSKLTNSITLGLQFDKQDDIRIICKIIDYVKNALKILSYTNDLIFDSIELRNEKKSYIGRIFDEKSNIHSNIRLCKSNRLYYNDVINKVFNNVDKLDVSKLVFINNETECNNYCIKLITLFAVFESNFIIKFKNYKSPKVELEHAKIIDDCLNFLLKYNDMNDIQFIEGLKNRIEKYNNSTYYKLKYALEFYCNKFNTNVTLALSRMNWLYYKEWNNKTEKVDVSAKKLCILRNTIVHTEKIPKIGKLEEFQIDAFEIIVYCMILDNLDLTDSEIIEHLEMFY